MVPEISVVESSPQTASVSVTGGQETNPLLATKISDSSFENAVREALTRSRVFSQILQTKDADYNLEVSIVELGQPMGGLDMTATLTTQWKLFKRGEPNVVWNETISTVHTASVSDAFVGIERLRLATEGAGKKNIGLGIRKLIALNVLPKKL